MPGALYHPREPQNTAYYQCIEDHFEAFERVYVDRFERQYGFFRSYVRTISCRWSFCSCNEKIISLSDWASSGRLVDSENMPDV